MSNRKPLSLLKRSDRFRIYRADGSRVLGIITPIENQPACSNAECHAHPASTQILGVLDTNLSLAKVDESLAQDRHRMMAYFTVALITLLGLSGVFIGNVVHAPLRMLKHGTERVAKGELGAQIPVTSNDEIGEVAQSFNEMSNKLLAGAGRNHRMGPHPGRQGRGEDARAEAGPSAHAARGEDGDHRQDGGRGGARD